MNKYSFNLLFLIGSIFVSANDEINIPDKNPSHEYIIQIDKTENIWEDIGNICKTLNKKIVLIGLRKIPSDLIFIEYNKLDEFLQELAENNNCSFRKEEGTIFITAYKIVSKFYNIPIVPFLNHKNTSNSKRSVENIIINIETMLDADQGESFFLDESHNILHVTAFKKTHDRIKEYIQERKLLAGRVIKLNLLIVETSLGDYETNNDKEIIKELLMSLLLYKRPQINNQDNYGNVRNILDVFLQDDSIKNNISIMIELEAYIMDNHLFFIQNETKDHNINANNNYINKNIYSTKDGYIISIIPVIQDNKILLNLFIKMKNFKYSENNHQSGTCKLNLFTSVHDKNALVISGIKTQVQKKVLRKISIFNKLSKIFSFMEFFANYYVHENKNSNIYIAITTSIQEDQLNTKEDV